MSNETLDLLNRRLAEVEQAAAPLNAEAARLRAAIDAVKAVDARNGATAPATVRRSKPAKRRALSRSGRAPRGANREKILAATKAAPKTASEIEAETGIPAATAASTMNAMARRGLLRKAARGYVAA